MGWQDRDYNQEDDASAGGPGGDYLANPAAILGFSLPVGSWRGVRVSLHFWLLLPLFLSAVAVLLGANLLDTVIYVTLWLVALLAHEWAHRWAARRLGGRHEHFMLWPAGGMYEPSFPRGRWQHALFVFGAGPAANLLLAIFGAGALWGVSRLLPDWSLLRSSFDGAPATSRLHVIGLAAVVCSHFCAANLAVFVACLLPYYWFDGAHILEAILTPFAGPRRALGITCIIGMVLAVCMFLLAARMGSVMGMVLWALLFASAYTIFRHGRRSCTAEPEGIESWADIEPAATGPRSRRWWRRRAKVAADEPDTGEEQRIDEILAKVSEQGMNSLTWRERRALKKATARRQRQER